MICIMLSVCTSSTKPRRHGILCVNSYVHNITNTWKWTRDALMTTSDKAPWPQKACEHMNARGHSASSQQMRDAPHTQSHYRLHRQVYGALPFVIPLVKQCGSWRLICESRQMTNAPLVDWGLRRFTWAGCELKPKATWDSGESTLSLSLLISEEQVCARGRVGIWNALWRAWPYMLRYRC